MKAVLKKVILVCSVLSFQAFAGTDTHDMKVKVTVAEGCTINNTATNLVIDFGTISDTTSDTDASTNMTLQCTNGTDWAVYAGDGNNISTSQRRMASKTLTTTEYINYDLYSNSTRATAFPKTLTDSNANADTHGTGDGQTQTVAIYGRIPSGTKLPSPDDYEDTVTMTVEW